MQLYDRKWPHNIPHEAGTSPSLIVAPVPLPYQGVGAALQLAFPAGARALPADLAALLYRIG